MALVRWDPFREIEDMQRRVASAFAAPFVPAFRESLTRTEWSPAVDIAETPEAYSIHAELPGVKKEDVKVSIDEGVLTVSGERRQEQEEKNKKWHRVERSYGRFERSFTLPSAVNADKVTATYKDGTLNVLVPKTGTTPAKSTDIKID